MARNGGNFCRKSKNARLCLIVKFFAREYEYSRASFWKIAYALHKFDDTSKPVRVCVEYVPDLFIFQLQYAYILEQTSDMFTLHLFMTQNRNVIRMLLHVCCNVRFTCEYIEFNRPISRIQYIVCHQTTLLNSFQIFNRCLSISR